VRIIQIVPVLEAGGLERIATTLSVRLAAGGDRVVVCTAGAHYHLAFRDELRMAGVPIVLTARPERRPDRLLRATFALARTIRGERPDVLHAHNPIAAVAGAAARRLARRPDLPVVATYHGLVGGETSAAARLLRATADVVVGVGPAATADLVRAGLDEARTETVLNAVVAEPTRAPADVRRELDVTDAELVVTIGRYRPEKDQALLLEAVARLAPSRPRLRALLVGGGPLEADLRARVAELGLDGVAHVVGLRADAVDVAAAADVVTLTSIREGLGLTLIEAMAVGTPTIGTAVGGILDVIDDGRTGLLVPSGDADALAAAIARLLDDADLARRLADAGRAEVAARFSVEAMVEGYRAVYARALRSRPSARRAGARPSK
jgi:glycosyltransferase involved in cell wall biosynthesis